MQKAVIMVLVVLLLLAVILGSVLGPGNKCPEQLYVRVYNEDSESYLIKDAVVGAVCGEEMTVETHVTDNDIRMLLSYPQAENPAPTVTPTPAPAKTPRPSPTRTATPSPTPQLTGLRKWVEDRRFVTSEECAHGYLVKVLEMELCSAEVSYGHNIISILGQTFQNTGMVYVRTSLEKYELVYISGLDTYFLTNEEYVVFCIEAGINGGGTL